jgi:F420-0:gamma-glutamyl ligase
MEFRAVRVRRLLPPKDDLLAALGESLPEICDGDVLLIATKVLAIHQGRCVKKTDVAKLDLLRSEADGIGGVVADPCVTLKGDALVPNAGVDESNGGEYYVLWPQNVEYLLAEIHDSIGRKFHLKNLGIISTDSWVLPMRAGTVGISQGSFGFIPVESCIGQEDLFGRPLGMSKVNIADALAGIAPLIMGEAGESCPVAIVRGVEGIRFSTERHSNRIAEDSDIFRDLLKVFRKSAEMDPHVSPPTPRS